MSGIVRYDGSTYIPVREEYYISLQRFVTTLPAFLKCLFTSTHLHFCCFFYVFTAPIHPSSIDTTTKPKVAIAVGAFLRVPRELGHSGNFTDLFSSVREEQRDYIDGLLVVSVIFSFLFLIWAFVLIILKCKGKEVGCASGRAFVSLRPDDEKSEADLEKTQDDTGSTSDSSNAKSVISVSSNKPLFSEYGGTVIENSSSDFSDDNNHSDRKSRRCLERNNKKKEGQRERRTRLTFIVFASIALICAPFTLFLTFGPLKETVMEVATTQNPDSLILVRTGQLMRKMEEC